jgi:3-methyl-2-oxobutanoate hydroxymethyltransferase
MVVQGKKTTREVSLAQMVYHVRMVAEAGTSIPVIGDLPYHTFETADEALENARVLMKAGAWAVKFEGNHYEAARAIVEEGIPLMGHLGLLPQTAEKFSVHGKSEAEAKAIEEDALQLEEAGVFSLVLESIPRGLAEKVSRSLSIPSIGIGAGPDCDGQVLVTHDMLGLTVGRVPKFVKKYADIGQSIQDAASSYAKDVRDGSFPSDAHTYH